MVLIELEYGHYKGVGVHAVGGMVTSIAWKETYE